MTTPATCQAKGVEIRTCACGESETREIAINPNAHTYNAENTCIRCSVPVSPALQFILQNGTTYKVADYTGTEA